MKTGSLRFRLFVASALSVFVALMLAFWGLGLLFASHVERRAIDDLLVHLDQILAGVERDGSGQVQVGAALTDARFSRPLGGLYWQIEADGKQMRSRSLWDYTLDLPPDDLNDGAVHVHYLAGPGTGRLLVMEQSVRLPARLGGVPMRVAVAMDAARIEDSTAEFRQDLLPLTLLLAVFLVVASVVQVLVGLRPLNAVERRISRVRAGQANRVGGDFPTEIRPLTAEVDALLEQREKDIEQARHRAGDLAHGLKTPLQALLGEASRLREAGLSDSAASIEAIADSMVRHVERELNRVRIASRAAAAKTDLAAAVTRIVSVVRKATLDGDLDWMLDVPAGLMVAADSEDLSEILGAITENAARHAAGAVRITARNTDTQVELNVRDDGPGIPVDKIETLMRRGARADESGTGLGLAIARELSETLGGGLHLVPGESGLTVRILLPLAGGGDAAG